MTPRDIGPSDLCLTLCAVQVDHDWPSADEIRGRLERLGFEGLTAQRVAAALRRLERMDAPPVESRKAPWGDFREYRTSGYGRTWLSNRLGWTRAWR